LRSKKSKLKAVRKKLSSRQLAITIAKILDEKKARKITILDVKKITILADYFVIATADHTKHTKALADEIIAWTDTELAKMNKVKIFGIEGIESLRWVLIDYGTVVVHIFLEETRNYYALEQIWADAKKIKKF